MPKDSAKLGVLNTENEWNRYLCVTLKRSTRTFVDVHDDAVWITGQIDAYIDIDLRHLFVNLCLLGRQINRNKENCGEIVDLFFWLSLLDVGL